MKILKSTEYSYLKRNYSKYGVVGLVALFIGIALLIIGINIYKTNPFILLMSFPVLGIGVKYLRKSRNYGSGIKGEKSVTEELFALDDSYYLVNDVVGITNKGNIDHIILSSKGIFVIECKNFSGEIRCYGDRWFRKGNRKSYEISSITKQAKNNSLAVSNCLYRKTNHRIFVIPICVFTNPNVKLVLNYTNANILKLEELVDFILGYKPKHFISDIELQIIGKSILEETIRA